MSVILQTILQPTTASVAIALLLAFYLVWALARQRYLGVYQQFDVLAISLSVSVAAVLVTQIIYPGHLVWPWPLVRVAESLQQPFTIVAIFSGYVVAAFASWWYIRSIRYPYWKVMDSNILGISLLALGWLAGIMVQHYAIPLVVAAAGWAIACALLLVVYHRIDRPGLVTGLHLILIWSVIAGLRYTLVSWQGVSSIVEYTLAGIAVVVGLAIVIVRLRVGVPYAPVAQLPLGVSQRFRDTFNRYIGSKQPSKPDGSSHIKKESRV